MQCLFHFIEFTTGQTFCKTIEIANQHVEAAILSSCDWRQYCFSHILSNQNHFSETHFYKLSSEVWCKASITCELSISKTLDEILFRRLRLTLGGLLLKFDYYVAIFEFICDKKIHLHVSLDGTWDIITGIDIISNKIIWRQHVRKKEINQMENLLE